MSDDLNRQIFKEEAYDLLGELEGALLELEEAPEDMDTVNQVFRALHTIKGSGSMFGFDDIAEFTHEVESTFDKVETSAHPLLRAHLALCTRFYAVIAPQPGLNPGFFGPFLAEMPDFGRTSPFRLAPVEQLSSN